jgi:hypothetical protein
VHKPRASPFTKIDGTKTTAGVVPSMLRSVMNPAPSTSSSKGEEQKKEQQLAYFGKNYMEVVEKITMEQHEVDMEGFFD